MKKWSFLLLACAATLLFMVGCGEQTASSGASSAAGQFRLYRVTVFAGAGFPAKRKNPNPSPTGGKARIFFLVREKGVEPSLFRNWCLKPARLPFRHSRRTLLLTIPTPGPNVKAARRGGWLLGRNVI